MAPLAKKVPDPCNRSSFWICKRVRATSSGLQVVEYRTVVGYKRRCCLFSSASSFNRQSLNPSLRRQGRISGQFGRNEEAIQILISTREALHFHIRNGRNTSQDTVNLPFLAKERAHEELHRKVKEQKKKRRKAQNAPTANRVEKLVPLY